MLRYSILLVVLLISLLYSQENNNLWESSSEGKMGGNFNNIKKSDLLEENNGVLTMGSRAYLMDENTSFEEKVQSIDGWKDQAKLWFENERYKDANSLGVALLIAIPRLELVREIDVLKVNIDAYERFEGDKKNPSYINAKTILEKVQRDLLVDGSPKIHNSVRIRLMKANDLMIETLDDLSMKKSKKNIEAGVLELSKTSSRTYEVKLILSRRESLWRIAEYESVYNNPWKWTLIYEANRDIIKDPDLIYPGQKFKIPPLTSGE